MIDVSLPRDEAVTFSDWPFAVVGPEESCPCGCPRYARTGDGGWRCEGCGEVVRDEDCPAPCSGCEASLEQGDDCPLEQG